MDTYLINSNILWRVHVVKGTLSALIFNPIPIDVTVGLFLAD